MQLAGGITKIANFVAQSAGFVMQPAKVVWKSASFVSQLAGDASQTVEWEAWKRGFVSREGAGMSRERGLVSHRISRPRADA
jgi:hypothetical protein